MTIFLYIERFYQSWEQVSGFRLSLYPSASPRDYSYVIGIPLGFGLVGMWVGFALDENIRGVILMRRWRSGKWKNKGFVKE